MQADVPQHPGPLLILLSMRKAITKLVQSDNNVPEHKASSACSFAGQPVFRHLLHAMHLHLHFRVHQPLQQFYLIAAHPIFPAAQYRYAGPDHRCTNMQAIRQGCRAMISVLLECKACSSPLGMADVRKHYVPALEEF